MLIQNITILLIFIKIIFGYFLYTEKSLYKLSVLCIFYGSAMFFYLYGRIPNDITENYSFFSNILIISFLILTQAIFHLFYLLTNLIKNIKNTYKRAFSFASLLVISEILISYSMSIIYAKKSYTRFCFF